MKRHNHRIKFDCILEIVFQMDIKGFDNVAASKVVHPKSVKKKYLITEEELVAFNDLVESVCSVIYAHNFDVIGEGQSGKSYSYYIDFFPTDENGDRWDESIRIKFRLSNHGNKGVNNRQINRSRKGESESNSPLVFVKSFFVGGIQYPSQLAVMKAVDQICKGLKEGNYNVLSEY